MPGRRSRPWRVERSLTSEAKLAAMPTAKGFNTTTELRAAWAHFECRPDLMVRALFPTSLPTTGDGYIYLGVAPPTLPAWTFLAEAMVSSGVTFDEWAGGTYNCRNIAGTTLKSPHAYGVAFDLNPARNPASSRLIMDLPLSFVQRVLALRTVNGRRVFRWGGDWDDNPDTAHSLYDPMHFEITCGPDDLATGLVEEPMALTPEQEQFVVDMYDFVVNGTRWVAQPNGTVAKVAGYATASDGSFAGPAVDLIRSSRSFPLHNHPDGTAPDLSGLVTKAQFNGHQHPEGTTGTPSKPLA